MTFLRGPLVMAACVSAPSMAFGADAPPDEVTVRGETHPPAATRVRREETREIPGTAGDPARALESMPGTAPVQSVLPFYFVRGATPSATGYFVDGVRVPFLSHAPPAGGVLASRLVDHVDFFPGASPARFGRFVGGTLSVETTAPSDRLRADGAVRLYDAAAFVETPFAEGRGSIGAGGRVGYTQPLLNLVEPSVRQTYWDYQLRGSWGLSGDDRVGVFAFGSKDAAGTRDEKTFDSEFHRLDLRYDVVRSRAKVRVALTLGADRSGNNVGAVFGRTVGARVDSTHLLSADAQAHVGADVAWTRFDVEVERVAGAPDPNLLFSPRDEMAIGAYGDVALRLTPELEVAPGVRMDVFTSQRDAYPASTGRPRKGLPPSPGATARFGVDPRLSTRLRVSGKTTLVSSFGVSHQPPGFFLPAPALVMSRLEDGLQTAVQASQGVEVKLPADFTLAASAFLHNYLNLSDPTATCPSFEGRLFNPTADCFGRRVRGRSFGLEVLFRRPLTKRLTAWVSYTLSRTTREAHARGEYILGASREALEDVLSEWDRTHVLTLIGGYDLGRGWKAGARFVYYTGRPYSHTIQGVLVPPYNADRLPDFYRLDLRLEKRWALGEGGSIAVVFEGFNVTFNREAIDCVPGREVWSEPVPAFIVRGPRDPCTIKRNPAFALPSIGVEASL